MASTLFCISVPSVTVPVTLGFEQSSYVVTESEGTVQVCAAVQDPADLRREITVTVQTVNGTASELVHGNTRTNALSTLEWSIQPQTCIYKILLGLNL